MKKVVKAPKVVKKLVKAHVKHDIAEGKELIHQDKVLMKKLKMPKKK